MGADNSGGHLFVLDGLTGAVRGGQPLTTGFQDAAITPDGNTIAVGLSGSTEVRGHVIKLHGSGVRLSLFGNAEV